MQARKKGGVVPVLDISKPGKTTVVMHYGPPSQNYPRGGTLNRAERVQIHRTETWDSIFQRLLDFYDEHQTDPTKRSYTVAYAGE
jgi:hypothetical protein